MDEQIGEQCLSELRKETVPAIIICIGFAGFALILLDYGNAGIPNC